jgi:uncharacterized protein
VRIAGFVVAVLVVLALVALSHWYVWRRLVRDTTRSRRLRIGGAVLVTVLALSIPAAVASRSSVPPLAAVGYVWLALWFYLLLALGVTELLRPVLYRMRARRPAATPADPAPAEAPAGPTDEAPAEPTDEAPAEVAPATGRVPDRGRRLLVSRGVAIGAGLVAAGTVGYGMVDALGTPRIRRVRIELAKLPRSRDGYRIALISDLHLGPLNGKRRTEKIVELVNGLSADAVAICGDLVDGTVAELGAAAHPLAGLRARDGSYFVTGNHDYYSGYRPWLAEVASMGIRPLHNARTDLGGLVLAGVNDATGGDYDDPPDYARTLDGRDTSVPVVLLAHQPVQVHEAARHGVDLQLSGHTHGGQMFPFHLAVRAVQPVVSGYARIDGTQLFVTNGVGFWGPPVRVGAPADVTLVQLHAPA